MLNFNASRAAARWTGLATIFFMAAACLVTGCSDPADKVQKAATSDAKKPDSTPTQSAREYSIRAASKINFIGSKVTRSHNGGFTNFVSSLGTGWIYVERFRGNDNLLSRINQATQAADQLVDLLVSWSRVELGKHPKYANLRRFLHFYRDRH